MNKKGKEVREKEEIKWGEIGRRGEIEGGGEKVMRPRRSLFSFIFFLNK